MDWWKRYPIYQIYPRSFKDSNGDGVGDIKGILSKLDYLEWLGIKVIWISPIYESPMMDFGYDISNYKNIDSLFGNLDDFKELVKNLHEKDMRLIMDFVPNHTSDRHPWFADSKLGIEPYSDYYVWRDPVIDPDTSERKPPNNVMAVFGGSAWTWCEEREKYYLHHFLPEQPNLNYNNPQVRREMTDVLKFWVDIGVDGFRIDAVTFIGRDESHTSVPSSKNKNNKSEKSGEAPTKEHAQTFDTARPPSPSYKIIAEWVKFLKDTYESGKNPRHIFVCTEGYTDLDGVLKYYDTGVDFPFNFSLVNWTKKSTAKDLRRWVGEWMKRMHTPTLNAEKHDTRKRKLSSDHKDVTTHQPTRWPNWVAGNHDQSRVATRLGGSKYVNVVNALLLLLPGTPTCYQGDELGAEDVPVLFEQCRDPYGKRFGPDHYASYTRDPCRSPMIWQGDKKYGGFTAPSSDGSFDVGPWLPLSDEKSKFAVDKQKENPNSNLNFFRRLLKLRDSEPIFHRFGDNFRLLFENEDAIFVFERWAPNRISNWNFLIILNVDQKHADQIREIDLSDEIDCNDDATVVLASSGDDGGQQYREGMKLNLDDKIKLQPGDVLILKFEEGIEAKMKKI